MCRILPLRPSPASYCGESNQVSNKYDLANYTHPLQLRQSQVFCRSAPLVSPAGAKPRPLVYHNTHIVYLQCDKSFDKFNENYS